MGKKEERVHESCVSDRSHVMMSDISNFHDYKNLIQEQMMHEKKFHEKHFSALLTSTRVELKKVVDSGCLSFGDHLLMMTLPMMNMWLPLMTMTMMHMFH